MEYTQVPQEVHDSIKALAATGAVNMMFHVEVCRVLREFGKDSVADWIERHKREYARGVLYGMEVIGTEHPD